MGPTRLKITVCCLLFIICNCMLDLDKHSLHPNVKVQHYIDTVTDVFSEYFMSEGYILVVYNSKCFLGQFRSQASQHFLAHGDPGSGLVPRLTRKGLSRAIAKGSFALASYPCVKICHCFPATFE